MLDITLTRTLDTVVGRGVGELVVGIFKNSKKLNSIVLDWTWALWENWDLKHTFSRPLPGSLRNAKSRIFAWEGETPGFAAQRSKNVGFRGNADKK